MQQWLIIISLIASGLIIAGSTYNAGLRLYAIAIAASSMLGYLLVGFGFHWGGWPLVAVSALLILISHIAISASNRSEQPKS